MVSHSQTFSITNNLCYRTATDSTEDDAGQTVLPLSLQRASEVGAVVLTHPNVPKAALPQLRLQRQRSPGHLPGVPPKAHGEWGGVGTGLGQVITQSVIAAYQWEEVGANKEGDVEKGKSGSGQ